MKTQKQVWDLWSYDVWDDGDGPYVNDRRCLNREIEIEVEGDQYNVGTDEEFDCFDPTEKQFHKMILEYFEVELSDLEFDGDDTVCYVRLSDDGYPLCELHLISQDGRDRQCT